MSDPHYPAPRNRLRLATVSLHVSAVLYGLLALGVLALVVLLPDPADPTERWIQDGMLLFGAALCVLFALLPEVVVWGLGRRHLWAWIAGLVVFAMYVPSLFFPLGALGLWGLLDTGSRALFGMVTAAEAARLGAATGGGSAVTRSSVRPGCVVAAVVAVVGLVVLIPLVGVVAAIVIPNFVDAVGKAKQKQTTAEIRAIAEQVDQKRIESGVLPQPNAERTWLGDDTNESAVALDAWDHPLRYECWPEGLASDCTSYGIASAGSDGVFEHEDLRGYLGTAPTTPTGGMSFDADIVLIDGLFVRAPGISGGR